MANPIIPLPQPILQRAESTTQEIISTLLDSMVRKVEMMVAAQPSLFSSIECEKVDWKDLEESLVEAEVANRKESVPGFVLNYISSFIERIIARDDPKELFTLFKLLASHINSETGRLIAKVVERLKVHYPLLNEYLKGKENIITPKGVALLIQICEKGYGWPKDEITLQNIDKLPQLIEGLRVSPKEVIKQGWILFSPRNDHLVAVFVEKVKEHLQFCILDSKGTYRDAYWMEPFQKCLKGENEVAYTFRLQRQRDGYTCPIFVLLDLRNVLEGEESGRSLFHFITRVMSPERMKEIAAEEAPKKMFSFDLLPADMMKVTQSLKQIKSYRSDSPKALARAVSPTFKRKSPTDEIQLVVQTPEKVFASIDRHIRYNVDGDPLNLYVEEKYLRFLSTLIDSVIQNSPR